MAHSCDSPPPITSSHVIRGQRERLTRCLSHQRTHTPAHTHTSAWLGKQETSGVHLLKRFIDWPILEAVLTFSFCVASDGSELQLPLGSRAIFGVRHECRKQRAPVPHLFIFRDVSTQQRLFASKPTFTLPTCDLCANLSLHRPIWDGTKTSGRTPIPTDVAQTRDQNLRISFVVLPGQLPHIYPKRFERGNAHRSSVGEIRS